MSCAGHSLGVSYPSAEVQSVYFTAPADWANWSLSDKKSPQLSRVLLSILADLNNAVVWMVSIRPVISKSSSPCTNPSATVPRAPITIGIIVTFMFHSLINSLSRSRYQSFFSLFFQFYSVVNRDRKVHNLSFFSC